MSHHYSGPDFGFPHGDPPLDFTDLYAFPKPGEADKSILIMNLHLSAVVAVATPMIFCRNLIGNDGKRICGCSATPP